MSWTKAQIHSMLDTKPAAVGRAIVAIYRRQTADEKAAKVTTDANSVGFSAFDAEFLTSLAEFYLRTGFLTPAQLAKGRNKIKRYHRQLIEIADESGKQPHVDQLPSAAITAAAIGPGSDW